VPKPPTLQGRCGALVLVEVVVANGCSLVHAARRLVDASIRRPERPALRRGSGLGMMEAA
jgi:hypothetical protein